MACAFMTLLFLSVWAAASNLRIIFRSTFRMSRVKAVCSFLVKHGCLKQQAVIMISKGPHLRDQPAE